MLDESDCAVELDEKCRVRRDMRDFVVDHSFKSILEFMKNGGGEEIEENFCECCLEARGEEGKRGGWRKAAVGIKARVDEAAELVVKAVGAKAPERNRGKGPRVWTANLDRSAARAI
jgi:hypothetical protein